MNVKAGLPKHLSSLFPPQALTVSLKLRLAMGTCSTTVENEMQCVKGLNDWPNQFKGKQY